MGQPLFTFEDEFIDSLCGLDDASVKQTWVDALEDGRLEMQSAVQAKVAASPTLKPYAKDITVKLDHGAYVVVVPADIEDMVMEHELGTGDGPPQPVLRGGVVRGAGAAGKAITDGLEMS